MIDLVGEYRHKLDAKGRVSLPADFRKVLISDLKISLSPRNDCLYLFGKENFSAWVASFFEEDGGYRSSNARHEKLRRVLNSRARSIDLDAAGRISISSDLREKVGLGKEVVVVGNTDHVEIWDAKRWEDYSSEVDLSDLFSE